MRTSLDLHAIAFPRAGDVLIVPRIRRGANFIFLLSHSISLPPLPLMASVSVSLPALPRWRQHSEPGRDGAGFVVGLERSMIFVERDIGSNGAHEEIGSTISLLLCLQELVVLLFCFKFDEEVATFLEAKVRSSASAPPQPSHPNNSSCLTKQYTHVVVHCC